jgi:hypothetical protein
MTSDNKGPSDRPPVPRTGDPSRKIEKREPPTVRDTHKPPAPIPARPGEKDK